MTAATLGHADGAVGPGGTERGEREVETQTAAAEPSRRRPIRSFVLREGRLTPAQSRAFAELWPLFGVNWQPGILLDPTRLFGTAGPAYLEIGFGNGETLAQMATDHPERRYLGVEVHRPGVGHLLLELERRGLTNVRVLRQDAVELLTHGLRESTLAGINLFFPDPWPKQRHHKRRILTPAFVALLARAIRPGGIFHAATDWSPYAEQMLAVLTQAGDVFANTNPAGGYCQRPDGRPLTKFERRGQTLGHTVHDLVFRRR